MTEESKQNILWNIVVFVGTIIVAWMITNVLTSIKRRIRKRKLSVVK